MDKITGQAHSGSFTVNQRQIAGTLTEAGDKSKLYLYDPKFFHLSADDEACIQGQLHNLVKVSLVDCISPGSGSYGRSGNRMHNASVFPHYIVSGDHYLSPHEQVVSQIEFCINDADMLFFDHQAFGHIIHGEKFIEQIANADNEPTDKNIATGPYPEIFYFTGVYEIASVDTAIGTVSVRHSPSIRSPGPWGIEMTNSIITSLGFAAPVTFEMAMRGLLDLQRYLDILIGRPQNVANITLVVPIAGKEHPARLSVEWSMAPKNDYRDDGRRPQPGDMLIEPVRSKQEFANTTAAYFSRHSVWRTARWRFSGNFDKARHYTIDRLVSAANVFDILPDHIFGPPIPLEKAAIEARDTARAVFKKLPASSDRESILNALGRLGKWSLKKKIANRIDKFIEHVDDIFPELGFVTDKAVNARNFFVHGGDKEIDYEKHDRVLWFFLDTLEFVFAASDLAEAGWDVKAWANKLTGLSHPFAGYKHEYKQDLATLKNALGLTT